MLKREQKRHDIMLAGLSASIEMLGDEPTDESTILACNFLWELTSDHKRQRVDEARRNQPSQ